MGRAAARLIAGPRWRASPPRRIFPEMPDTITLDGQALLAERPPSSAPARPPILFVHGLVAGAWLWESYLRWFAARGYPSYAVNLRGRPGGRPAADLGRVGIMDFVTDARDAARHLGTPVVVGHSMGGLIAQKLAEANVVRAAVLLASAPPRGISVASPVLLRKQLKHAWALARSRPIEATRADSDALSFTHIPEAERAALQARFVPDSGRAGREISLGAVAVDASRIRCPVLVLTGADDRFVVPRVARALAAKYRADLRELPGHAHMLPLEPGWERGAAQIEEWLARAVPGEGAARPVGAAPA